MPEFNTSLLREKFVIRDVMPTDEADSQPVVALSNRLVLPLTSANGNLAETFVIRAQNMHTCARMAAQLARDFHEDGPILNRQNPYDWEEAYQGIIAGYEKKWNPNRWIVVYNKGRVVYEGGEVERHPFLDIIEQCDARSRGDYSQAMNVAEDAFKQAGKLVMIEHDSNVAMIMSIKDDEGKCGIIVRSPNRTTTFTMALHKHGDNIVKPSQCLSAVAAFLEGIQMAFLIGMAKQKLAYELITQTSDESKKSYDASKKLGRLNIAIAQFETLVEVTYRPERPEFSRMIDEAQEFARRLLSDQIEEKMRDDKENWIA